MKAKILTAAALWLSLITFLHIQLNVGWERMVDGWRVLLGGDREEVIVGYLPVT